MSTSKDTAPVAKASPHQTWLLAFAALVAVAFAASGFTQGTTETTIETRPTAPLWVPARLECDVPEGRAFQRGKDLEAAAQAKLQRYEFFPAEGPRALLELASASVCFGAASASRDEARAEASLALAVARIDSDVAQIRNRLEVAIRLNQRGQALAAVESLLVYYQRNAEEYATWLRNLEQELSR